MSYKASPWVCGQGMAEGTIVKINIFTAEKTNLKIIPTGPYPLHFYASKNILRISFLRTCLTDTHYEVNTTIVWITG
ncbi:MAG: hypothetical protein JXB88_01860 [Spirochaetales bacterium]|nr:hypothetical protein [Spirochaetales bacterium]